MREPTVLCLSCKRRTRLGLMSTAITCRRCIAALVRLNKAS